MASRRKRVSFRTAAGPVSFLAGGGSGESLKLGETLAHRGYLIKRTFRGFVIEKGGAYIGTAQSIEKAREAIGLLT